MKKLNVALIGYKFMGKAHSYALMATPFFFKTGIEPVRKVIVGRNLQPLEAGGSGLRLGGIRNRLARGRARVPTSMWSTLPRRPAHTPRSPSPPLAPANTFSVKSPSRPPSKKPARAFEAVGRAGVKHMLGFNYRRVPAIGLARQLIESGRLGTDLPFPGRLSAGLDHGPAVPADLETEQSDRRLRFPS